MPEHVRFNRTWGEKGYVIEDADVEGDITLTHDDNLQPNESIDPVRPSQNAGLIQTQPVTRARRIYRYQERGRDSMLILTLTVSAAIGAVYFLALDGNSDIGLWFSSLRKWSYDNLDPQGPAYMKGLAANSSVSTFQNGD